MCYIDKGDAVMADRGFDIEEDLILREVRLNIPPFLRGKQQLNQAELVETRQIASCQEGNGTSEKFSYFYKPLLPSFLIRFSIYAQYLQIFILHFVFKIISHIITDCIILYGIRS